MRYPRVLHIGFDPIGAPTNTGLTLGSMFTGWPEDSLLQLAMPGRQSHVGFSEIIEAPASIAPIDGAIRKMLGARLPSGDQGGLNSAVSRAGYEISLKTKLKIQASAANDVGPTWVSPRLVRRVEHFRPDVIHTLLGGVRPMRLVVKFSDRLSVPIVPHFMDDWADTLFADGQLCGLARTLMVRDLRKVIDRSTIGLAIGTDMKTEYEARFRRKFYVVGNSVDFSDYDELPLREPQGSKLKIRYVGGLHLGRADSLLKVLQAAARLENDVDGWEIDLFVPPSDIERARQLSDDSPIISTVGSLTPSQVPAALRGADVLLFVESSDENIHKFTRLSVSTKVPQYIAAQRPILTVGPSDQGSVRSIAKSGLGVHADASDPVSIGRALLEIRRKATTNEQVAKSSSIEWIRDIFGTEATRSRLREALEYASSPS